MLNSEQKCAHYCSEWNIVGYGTCALWDLWNWSTVVNRISQDFSYELINPLYTCHDFPKDFLLQNCVPFLGLRFSNFEQTYTTGSYVNIAWAYDPVLVILTLPSKMIFYNRVCQLAAIAGAAILVPSPRTHLTHGHTWVHIQHSCYWCPGAKAPGHQYPQCWPNIHCIATTSNKNFALLINYIRK